MENPDPRPAIYDEIVQTGIEARAALADACWKLGDITNLAVANITGTKNVIIPRFAAEIGFGEVAALEHYARVAATYTKSERAYDVPWSIYRLCRPLENRMEMIAKAADEQLTVAQMKRFLNGEPIENDQHQCPSCGRQHVVSDGYHVE